MLQPRMLFGFHAVNAAIKQSPGNVITISVDGNRADKRLRETIALAKKAGIPINKTSKKVLNDLVHDGKHQGIVASCKKTADKLTQSFESFMQTAADDELVLVLDRVQDPHNLGACLRSANAAGAGAVIAPKNQACGITPVVEKSSAGAAQTTPYFQVGNLAGTLAKLSEAGFWILGASDDAEQSYYDVDMRGKIALALGGEESGLRRLTRENCDQIVSIPMQGSVESLNVSVASSVMLYEAVRQRQTKHYLRN